ncbi:MAG: hypothetical protein HWE20_05430 [Gammaproteobacteria bacterium]|nr:hypothetical protein [Gammaproteobacteria bacterium]
MKALWMACIMFALSSTANAFPKGQWLLTETTIWPGVKDGYVLPYSLLLDVDDNRIEFKLAGAFFWGTLDQEPYNECYGDYRCAPFETLFSLSINARRQTIGVTGLDIHEHRIFDRMAEDRAFVIYPWRKLFSGTNYAQQGDNVVLNNPPHKVVFTRADRATAEAALGIAMATDLAYAKFNQCLEHHFAQAALGNRSYDTLDWMRLGFSAYRLLKAREQARPNAPDLAEINTAIANTTQDLLKLIGRLPEAEAKVIQTWGEDAPATLCKALSR